MHTGYLWGNLKIRGSLVNLCVDEMLKMLKGSQGSVSETGTRYTWDVN